MDGRQLSWQPSEYKLLVHFHLLELKVTWLRTRINLRRHSRVLVLLFGQAQNKIKMIKSNGLKFVHVWTTSKNWDHWRYYAPLHSCESVFKTRQWRTWWLMYLCSHSFKDRCRNHFSHPSLCQKASVRLNRWFCMLFKKRTKTPGPAITALRLWIVST